MPLPVVRYFEYQPVISTSPSSTNPVLITIQSLLVTVHAITSLKIVHLEIVTFNNGVPKCTALLHGKAVSNVLPILIDDGQLSSTSLTCPVVHPRNSRQSSSQPYCWTPPSHENNVVYVGLVIILPFTKQLRTLTSQDTPGYKETWDKEEKREEWEMWVWDRVRKAIGMSQRQELESKTRAGGGWLAPGGTPDWSWHTHHLVNGLSLVVV